MPKVCTIFKRDHDRLKQKYKTTHKNFVEQRRKSRNLSAQVKRRDKALSKLEKKIESLDNKIKKISKRNSQKNNNSNLDDSEELQQSLKEKLNTNKPQQISLPYFIVQIAWFWKIEYRTKY